jgi:hypothetical protein
MQPIPLFGTGINALSPYVTAQRRLNCFWDIRGDKDKSDAVLVGTFGLTLWVSLPTYPVRGWRVVGNLLYIIGGSVLYKLTNAGTLTAIGSVASNSSKVSMSDNGAQLVIVDGINLYCYTIVTGSYSQAALNAAGSFGQVTDGNFPNGATTITFIDGRFIVEAANTRQAYVSASYDGTLWTPLIFFTKENYSDNLLAVDVFNGIIILWGVTSMEFWQDAGGSPLPYARVQGATQQWGLAALWSRAKCDNTVIFLGKSPQGAVQVMMLDGYQPKRISTTDIEVLIEEFGVYSDAVAVAYSAHGHVMYQLTFPNAGRSIMYDATANTWQETQTGLALVGRHVADLGVTFGTLTYVSDYQNGNVYFFDDLAFTDNGVPIKRQVVSRHIRNGGNKFGLGDVFLDVQLGNSLQSGQGSDPQMSMEMSKDNGNTFGIPRLKSMGLVGQYRSPRVIWKRNGRAFDFVLRFTMTDPVEFIITGGAAAPKK